MFCVSVLGENIKQIRVVFGVSQRELAIELSRIAGYNIKQQSIAHAESGDILEIHDSFPSYLSIVEFLSPI